MNMENEEKTTACCEECVSSGANVCGPITPNATTQIDRELTFGEKAVGLTFNPGNNPDVDEVKRDFAKIIDKLNNMRGDNRSEQSRRMSIAITRAEIAQMCAVNAITWKD